MANRGPVATSESSRYGLRVKRHAQAAHDPQRFWEQHFTYDLVTSRRRVTTAIPMRGSPVRQQREVPELDRQPHGIARRGRAALDHRKRYERQKPAGSEP
jgi:hypothetical protein